MNTLTDTDKAQAVALLNSTVAAFDWMTDGLFDQATPKQILAILRLTGCGRTLVEFEEAATALGYFGQDKQ